MVFEYRRFLLLLATSDEPLTPSDQVDQAWHLHLAYTESYWQDLCHGVLQQRLHHGPTRGGERENRKFERWYERTLSTYAQVFGEAPPSDIWPPARARFRDASRYQRVNRATHVLVPWPRFLRGAVLKVAVALTLSGIGAWILSARGATAAEVLTVVCAFLLVFLVFGAVFANIGGGRGRGAAGGAGGYGACGGCGGGGCGGCGS